ncbi:MAG TPA: hypothetical protein VMZ71_02070, partial [Gemmataceae bacterium]|nr:hypothetical protein [Gemmataceae bacterium]
MERRPLVALWRRLSLSVATLALFAPALRGQDREPELLRLQGVGPTGTRATVTESFSTFKFIVQNLDTSPREARVVVYYPEQEDVQFARDVWVPAQSAVTTWLPVGPAQKQSGKQGREIRMLLYDRTNGGDRLVLPPGTERIRSRAVIYTKREPTTALVRDPPSPVEDLSQAESVRFSHVVRNVIDMPDRISHVGDRTLPPTPEAFDGLDVLILAGNQLDGDPPGRAAVRRWVEQGGTLWVMLDHIQPDSAASVLGDDFDITEIDRVGLTTVLLTRPNGDTGWAARDEEKPVTLVRV